MTCDTWPVTRDTITLKISAPQLLWFVIYDILNIWRKRLTDWLTQLINDKGVCRAAPATPGLLITQLQGQEKYNQDKLSREVP